MMESDEDWIQGELARAAERERAPARLRARVATLEAGSATVGRRRVRSRPAFAAPVRLGLGLRGWSAPGLVGALAAVVLVLVLASGAGSAPSVRELARVGLGDGRWSDAPPRVVDGHLDVRLGRLRFPAWYGWPATSARRRRLDGRPVETVEYRRGSVDVVYSVAAAPRLAGQRAGYVSFRQDGRNVVTWTQDGMSCVASSRTASPDALLELAYLS